MSHFVKGGVKGDHWDGAKGASRGLRAGFSREEGRWSVTEAALLPRSGFGGAG